MKAGAFDYLKKPFEPEELEIVVARAVEHARMQRENARLRSALAGEFGVHGIIGKSQGDEGRSSRCSSGSRRPTCRS